jgi:hypothetical protein
MRAALLQLYAMQQIAMKQAQGKASRAVQEGRRTISVDDVSAR